MHDPFRFIRRAAHTPLIAMLVGVVLAVFVLAPGTQRAQAMTFAGGAPVIEATASATVRAQSSGTGLPAGNCIPTGNYSIFDLVDVIDICRAHEGIGPLQLPNNWHRLTAAEQLLTLTNLERVNRGLNPVIGLAPGLNHLAFIAAEHSSLPQTPKYGFAYGGSLWLGLQGPIYDQLNPLSHDLDPLIADYLVMYDNGYSATHTVNRSCTSPRAAGCWFYRRVELMKGEGLMAGGAAAFANGVENYTFEVVSDWQGFIASFTWSSELGHFAQRPHAEPLGRPTLAAITPNHATIRANAAVTITGTGLLSVKRFLLNGQPLANVFCQSETSCTAVIPASSTAGTVRLTAVGLAGQARQSLSFTYTAPPAATA